MGKKRYWNSEAKNARWIKEGVAARDLAVSTSHGSQYEMFPLKVAPTEFLDILPNVPIICSPT